MFGVVEINDLPGEVHLVSDRLSGGLHRRPQLEILGTVIVPYPIYVVHVLLGEQGATEQVFHYGAVLERLSLGVASRIHMRIATLRVGPCGIPARQRRVRGGTPERAESLPESLLLVVPTA